MAKIITERAYIEPFGEEEENSHAILVHIKQGNDHIYVGRVELTKPKPWILLEHDEKGELVLNYSAGMDGNKWDHITHYIIRGYDE